MKAQVTPIVLLGHASDVNIWLDLQCQNCFFNFALFSVLDRLFAFF